MGILVTGGSGYIGSHTILELFAQGYTDIYSIDNYVNSDESNYETIKAISKQEVNYANFDLADTKKLNEFFETHPIETVIHFAALKSVPESVNTPEKYYQNNLGSLLSLLSCMKKNNVQQLIFSSSCSVYGNPEQLPVDENTPFGEAESPYARTKQMGENIIKDFCKVNPSFRAISLRYFNPVGAHPSGLIGEGFTKRPNNLIPIITQTAAGLREQITVFGTDYNTPDGSCIRDYIHVVDIADAHVKATSLLSNMKEGLNYDVINLGTGKGFSVLEMLHKFEEVSDKKLNYVLGERRAGDVESIYANNDKAKTVLNWTAQKSIDEMLESAWNWQQNMPIDDDTSRP